MTGFAKTIKKTLANMIFIMHILFSQKKMLQNEKQPKGNEKHELPLEGI